MSRFFLKLIPIIIIVVSCQQAGEKVKEVNSEIKEFSPTLVRIQPSEEKKFEYLIHGSGKILPLQQAKLIVKTSGVVSKVFVSNGDAVKAGQIIAEFEDYQQKLNLEKAKILLNEKKISFDDQVLSFKNNPDTSIRKLQMENIHFTSGYANAEINYKQALYELEEAKVVSPISGIVSALQLKPFNPVDLNNEVAIIYNPNQLLTECFIAESDAILLIKGYKAEIMLPGLSPMAAIVYDIDRIVDEKTKLVRTQLLISGHPNLIPGMSVEVLIRVPFQKSILVAKEAIVMKNGKAVVFTEEGGLAKWNYVTVGRENGKEVEILSGLEPEKKVIVTNNLQLAHDAPVQIYY